MSASIPSDTPIDEISIHGEYVVEIQPVVSLRNPEYFVMLSTMMIMVACLMSMISLLVGCSIFLLYGSFFWRESQGKDHYLRKIPLKTSTTSMILWHKDSARCRSLLYSDNPNDNPNDKTLYLIPRLPPTNPRISLKQSMYVALIGVITLITVALGMIEVAIGLVTLLSAMVIWALLRSSEYSDAPIELDNIHKDVQTYPHTAILYLPWESNFQQNSIDALQAFFHGFAKYIQKYEKVCMVWPAERMYPNIVPSHQTIWEVHTYTENLGEILEKLHQENTVFFANRPQEQSAIISDNIDQNDTKEQIIAKTPPNEDSNSLAIRKTHPHQESSTSTEAIASTSSPPTNNEP